MQLLSLVGFHTTAGCPEAYHISPVNAYVRRHRCALSGLRCTCLNPGWEGREGVGGRGGGCGHALLGST